MRAKPELLIPASSLEVLKIAVIFGADAVYIGGEAFGLRAKARNFSMEDMKEGIEFAHQHHVKVYVTANILAHNKDLDGVREYFRELKEIRPDALIISDPGVFMIAKEVCPEIERHISTQANNTNYETYKFWYGLGAKRVVSARELSLEEIKQIRANIPDDLEIETFIHGAMCISYSGRCLLSNFFTGRDANQGACTHPCRWKYSIVEETRPGEYMPVYENERGTYIFNSKDLCMIEHMDDILTSGIDSLKIEGQPPFMWQQLQEPTEKPLMIILRVQSYTGKIWNGIKSRLWAVPIVCLPPDFFMESQMKLPRFMTVILMQKTTPILVSWKKRQKKDSIESPREINSL